MPNLHAIVRAKRHWSANKCKYDVDCKGNGAALQIKYPMSGVLAKIICGLAPACKTSTIMSIWAPIRR